MEFNDGLKRAIEIAAEAAQRYAQEISPEVLVALAERGISEEVAARFELGTVTSPHNGHEMYEGWISIPYITAGGSCVGFKFRRIDDGKPKYGSPTGQKAHLYNVIDILEMSPYIVVCEGELDAVITSGVLGIPAVGVPGVQAWKPHFPKLFNGYDTVYVVGDNDVKEDGSNPGAEFSKRVANEILNSVIVTLPPGMDINDYYLAYGADATRALLVGEKGE
jgi:DNA primase